MNKSCPVPICPSCKHFFEKQDNGAKLCCKAFPDGIPYNYMFGAKAFIAKECKNGYGFEDISATNNTEKHSDQ